MEKTKILGTESPSKLLIKFSVPAVIAMIVNSIYNVVDRIVIGKLVGEGALAGLTVVFPIMMIIFAFASLIGMGGASLISIKLGENDSEGASKVFGNTLSLGIVITTIIVSVFYINLDNLLVIFGATPDIIGYARDYMEIILFGFIFQMVAFILNNVVRTEGLPMLAMGSMIISAVTNIILDILFIGAFGMGVQGGALATIIGQFIGFAILLSFFVRGKSNLVLNTKTFTLDKGIVLSILSIGFATFMSTLGTSVAMTLINRELVNYGGTAAITSMGAINSLYTLFIMPIMGIQQGMQPILGYNYGAKLMARVYETLKIGTLVAVIFSTVIFILLETMPQVFMGMFLDAASDTMAIGIQGLRLFVLMLPVISINLFAIAFFQSIANGKTAMVLGILRQFAILIPALYILPKFFGLTGVWVATPIADGIAVAISLVVLLRKYKIDQSEINSINEKPALQTG